jgi:hypothetical protein
VPATEEETVNEEDPLPEAGILPVHPAVPEAAVDLEAEDLLVTMTLMILIFNIRKVPAEISAGTFLIYFLFYAPKQNFISA